MNAIPLVLFSVFPTEDKFNPRPAVSLTRVDQEINQHFVAAVTTLAERRDHFARVWCPGYNDPQVGAVARVDLLDHADTGYVIPF